MSLHVDGVEHATLRGWLNALLLNQARVVKRVERAIRQEKLEPLAVPEDRARCLEIVKEHTGVSHAALEHRGKKRTRSDDLEELAVLAKLLQACDPKRDAALRLKIQNQTLPIIESLKPADVDARLTVSQRIAMGDLPWLARGNHPAQIGKIALRHYVARYHCRPPQCVATIKGINVMAYTYTAEECAHTVDRAIQEYEEADDHEEEEEEEEDSFIVYTEESSASDQE